MPSMIFFRRSKSRRHRRSKTDRAVRARRTVGIFSRFELWAKPKVEAFEASATVHLLGYLVAVASAGALVWTFVQMRDYFEDREREWLSFAEEQAARQRDREIQEEERYERAWDRLLRRDPGDTRKGRAVSTLLEAGVQLEDLNLSCKTIGVWDVEADVCSQTATLSDLVLSEPATSFAVFNEFVRNPVGGLWTLPGFKSIHMGDFHDLRITNTNFSGFALAWSDPDTKVTIHDSIFTASVFTSVKTPPQIFRGDLSFSYWDLADHGHDPLSNISLSNMTGVVFDVRSNIRADSDMAPYPLFPRNESLQGPDKPQLGRGWAWADRPPTILDAAEGRLVPASIYHLHGIEFYDPKCRVNHQSEQDQSIDELTNTDLQGIEPKLRPDLDLLSPWNPLIAQERCMVGFWTDAAKRYPDRYPVVPQGYHLRWEFAEN